MRSLFPLSILLGASLLGASLLGACSDGGDEGLIITKNVALPVGSVGCTFSGEVSEPFIPHGYLDENGGGYLLHPQFESRIVADDMDDPSTILQRTVIVTDADVDVTFPAGGTAFSGSQFVSPSPLVHFKALMSVPVPPNSGTADGEVEVIGQDLVTAAVAAQPTGDIEVSVAVTAHGTMSGQTISSQKFEYPITLTTGLAMNLGPCPLPTGTTLTEFGDPCNVFQDQPVQCCEQADNSLLCPASISTM